MRKLILVLSTISIAALSMPEWLVLAQDGSRIGTPPGEILPSQPSIATKYRMFLEGGTPTRPSANVKVKAAGKPSVKKGPEEKGKVDQGKVRPSGLLATQNVTPDSMPPTTENNKQYRIKVRFPWLPPENDGWARVGTTSGKGNTQQTEQSDDDAALNAAACKAAAAKRLPLPSFCRQKTIQVDRLSYDRLDTDRFDQLGAGGPGGFSPNKP